MYQSWEEWAQTFRGLEAILPLYQGVLTDRERVKLEAISTIKLTMNRDHRQQKRTFWPEMLLMPHRRGDPSFSCLPWLDNSQPHKARLRKEGEESHSQTKLNPTQSNTVSTPQWWVEGKGREQINQALSPPQVTPDKTHLHSGEAEVLN